MKCQHNLVESRLNKCIFNLKACRDQLPNSASFAHRIRCKSLECREGQGQARHLQLGPQLGFHLTTDWRD